MPIKFTAPKFWFDPNTPPAYGLQRIASLYQKFASWRHVEPERVSVPVICVGNATMGGSGKTPVVEILVPFLKQLGHTPHVLSRGYGGSSKKTTRVDRAIHGYRDVGDEPLLLARVAPTWVGRDRLDSARHAIRSGATVLVCDDGLQDFRLYKDASILVVDALQGLGNGYTFPAGPLREPLVDIFSRIQAIVGIASAPIPFPDELSEFKGPFFSVRLVREEDSIPPGPVHAFAGLGFPEKFKSFLSEEGFDVRSFKAFPDHYAYTISSLRKLLEKAEDDGFPLVTTLKDFVRLPQEVSSRIRFIPVRWIWKDDKGGLSWLENICGRRSS